jgi:uncharacterized protein with NRDE domain
MLAAFCKSWSVCTLAIYSRMFEGYPMIVAANRDEHYDRPSAAPHVLDTARRIIAGRDLRAGGTWLGVNASGLMAGILNRRVDDRVHQTTDTRSRGLLCMDLLGLSSSAQARDFIQAHRARYNPFTVLFADKHEAHVCYNDDQCIISEQLEPGLHVLSSAAEFAVHSAKAERAYSLFSQLGARAQPRGSQTADAIAALQTVLADHTLGPGSDDPGDAICVHRDVSGTVSSSIIFLSDSESRFETFHCAGAPCQNSFGDALALDVW